jgi:serine/threonine-protein kinase
VEAGKHSAEHLALMPAAATELAGLSVTAVGDGLHVFVDGKDLGGPPVSLHDVEPGSHVVRVTGAEGLYDAYEQRVQLDHGEVRSLGPVRLHLLKGRLSLTAGEGADGATIAVDGRPVTLPTRLDLSPDAAHEVTATRPGFGEFEQQVVFDGTAERSVVVSLEPSGPGARVAAPRVAQNSPPRSALVSRFRSQVVSSPTPATSGSVATLDLNSIPRANVVVNGRPLGTTPLIGVRVPAGTQTIVFVHPTLGRKVASATVAAGARKAAFVRF